ncbi:hypothetical protein DPQ33_09820 [Oceanidesulfovibrio indonesiensis]|uniref:Uncharacterized protein n=1 Tax=Oceanidesulfovibrio indonesiensis TaxID=54767 RepID=A0A7M3ME47_9BACT|nr:hypothetical protein DPQ33_09820 [Oceanidesulfovibrio indonesiensis]
METDNVPIGSIQRILGHENRTTTEIYLHSLGESDRQAIEVLERVTVLKVPHRHKKGLRGNLVTL